ncbi:MAG: Smr/MutS family protein [Desulforegulaceae bacterium]|nr:Smr/MutS family protein [Desulforegulaceae bacterium]
MSLIKKLKSFFKKKIQKDSQFIVDEIKEEKPPELSDKKDTNFIFRHELIPNEKDGFNKVTKKNLQPKLVKKKKAYQTKVENKVKIRRISSKEDLYELFTGEKNPGINEYIPSQIKDLSNPGKNCKKEAKLNQKKVVDLHGLSSSEAVQKIENSIISAKHKGFGSVQFITGKGKHSQNMKPVLRSLAEKKAVEFKKRGKICSFEWEKKHKKKSGSIIFYL